MEIIIHGTKNGYRILFATNDQVGRLIASDITKGINTDAPLGKFFYAIAFSGEACYFTKYIIIKDTLRYYTTGTIAVSIYLKSDEKIKGSDVKKLLDELSGFYANNYIKQNYINNGEASLIKENWSFVEKIAGSINEKIFATDNIEDIQQGSSETAYMYYSSEEELEKFLDTPYQEEYYIYKQVLLIKSDLKNKDESPLNALRHNPVADLTGAIDFAKKEYWLEGFNGHTKEGASIEIRANGRLKKNKDKITSKDSISIIYSKNDYYDSIKENGKLYDKQISKYIEIEEGNKKLKVKDDVQLTPKLITFVFEIMDRKGNPVYDAAIQIGMQSWQKTAKYKFQYDFKGEELKQEWKIWAKKDSENLSSKHITIIPEKEGGTITLILKKKKEVEVFALENTYNISKFKVWINDGKGFRDDTILVFEDEDIEKTWKIEVQAYDGLDRLSGQVEYCPSEEGNRAYVQLNRKSGGKVKSQTGSSEEKKESIFLNRLTIGILVFVLLFGLGLVAYFHYSIPDTPQQGIFDAEAAYTYTRGIELNAETLDSFKREWKTYLPHINKEEGDENQADSTEFRKKDKVLRNLDSAIIKRKFIIEKDFRELKKQNYSSLQQKFKRVIDKIDSSDYKKVQEKLGNISALTLDEISDAITAILANKATIEELPSQTTQNKEDQDNRQNTEKIDKANETEKASKSPITSNEENKKPPESSSPQKKESSSLPEKKPKAVMPALSVQQSNPLETEFWKLVKDGNDNIETYKELLEKYKKKKDPIITFLNSICKNAAAFQKFMLVPQLDKKKANTISELENKMQ